MNLEIHKPELIQRVNAHIQAGHAHDTDELVEKALDALDEKAPLHASPKTQARDMVELFAPLRGLNIDFDRDPDPGRDLEM